MTMTWMMAAVLAGAAVVQPSREAEELGARLARTGTLATIAPLLIEKDVADAIKAHPEWSADDATKFRATARRVATADLAKLTAAFGHAYAKRLPLADLRVLVAAAESPAAARKRKAEPAALMEAMGSLGGIDFKGDALAAFCAETGKGCPAK